MAEKFQFDEYFLANFQLAQKLKQEQEELRQKVAMDMRQQSLLGKYHDSLLKLRGEEQDYLKPYYESMTLENLMPKQQKIEPIKGASLIPMYGGQTEEQYEIDPVTKERRVTGYGNFYKPDKETGGDGTNEGKIPKLVDVSGEVGEMNKVITLLDKLKSDDDTIEYTNAKDETVSVGKVFLRSEGKKYMADAMTKAGVPLEGDLVNEIRSMAGITDRDGAIAKRQKLRDAIDYARSQGVLNDQQFEALKYWSEISTR